MAKSSPKPKATPGAPTASPKMMTGKMAGMKPPRGGKGGGGKGACK